MRPRDLLSYRLSYITHISVNYIYPVVHYIPVFIYHKTGSLYLLTTFIPPRNPACGKHKSDLVFCEFVSLFVCLF